MRGKNWKKEKNPERVTKRRERKLVREKKKETGCNGDHDDYDDEIEDEGRGMAERQGEKRRKRKK